MLLDELAVAGFFQAAGLLAKEFEAPLKTFGETVFGGWVWAVGKLELRVFFGHMGIGAPGFGLQDHCGAAQPGINGFFEG